MTGAGTPGPAVYECPGCRERQAGTRRCEECNLFMRRLGAGGECPHCLLLASELFNLAETR